MNGCITREASRLPPAGLAPSQVPLFVSLGFDDNGYSGLPESGSDGGLAWLLGMLGPKRNPGVCPAGPSPTLDGAPARATFLVKGDNLDPGGVDDPALVARVLRRALAEGHELGCHSLTHPHGVDIDWRAGTRRTVMGRSDWDREISGCLDRLARLADPAAGLAAPRIKGFRTPYLHYHRETFDAVEAAGFLYDSSIEESWQEEVDGRTAYWPYTLHADSPGEVWTNVGQFGIPPQSGGHPGLWELPIGALIVPDDERCAAYGTKPGLRARMKATQDYFDDAGGKVTGLDWNLWFEFYLSPEDFFAVVAHSIDLRLEGNRAPLIFGGHSDIYSPLYDVHDMGPEERAACKADAPARRAALQAVVEYALSKDAVRVARMEDLAAWLAAPVPL